MTTKRIPKITPELLEWLEGTFKDRCPDVKTPDRQVWMDAGAARVVRHVRKLFEEQNRTILVPDDADVQTA